MIEAGRGPLDRPTTFASASSGTASEDGRLRGRAQAWSLREVAATLMPGHRVEGCGRHIVPGKDATVVATDGRHTFGNVQKCGAVWLCPVCQHKIAAQRADEVDRAVTHAGLLGIGVAFMTLTVGHDRTDELADLVDRQAKARRAMWSGRAAKARAERHAIVGSVSNLEVTYGDANGWHPHSHVLVFFRGDADQLGEAMWHAWERAATRNGFRVDRQAFDWQVVGVDIDAEHAAAYVAKPSASAKRAWSVGSEVAKSGAKRARVSRYTPFDLLGAWGETRDGRFAALWLEYASAFAGAAQGRGRRHLFWSRGLRDELRMGESLTDEEAANADGEGQIVGTLARDEWAWLRGAGLLREFLEVCDGSDYNGGMRWLRSLWGDGRCPAAA